MNDTPETDRQWAEWLNKLKMPIESFVEFARKLERERDQARLEAKLLRVENNHNWQANDLAEQAFRERDEARALAAEMKQAIIWAKAEAKERLHRLDQAACERRTWLEATHKMKLERDEARAERDEWIARFRADEQLIKEAMIPHPENPEP